MFGYVRTYTDDLKVRENAYYNSTYCGLCHAMGERVCGESRLSLSYDMVFLALIRYRLENLSPELTQKRCPLPPFKKKAVVKNDDIMSYCAAVGAILTWHKLDDDIRDSHGIKKLFAFLARSFFGRARKKANLPELEKYISSKLIELSNHEKSGEATVDSCAEYFGELLSYVFSYGLTDGKQRIATEIGRHVGRWIYFADAVDDLKKDIKRGDFNPLKDCFDAERCQNAMLIELQGAASANDLIDCDNKMISAITDNILHLGMPKKADDIINKTKGVSG